MQGPRLRRAGCQRRLWLTAPSVSLPAPRSLGSVQQPVGPAERRLGGLCRRLQAQLCGHRGLPQGLGQRCQRGQRAQGPLNAQGPTARPALAVNGHGASAAFGRRRPLRPAAPREKINFATLTVCYSSCHRACDAALCCTSREPGPAAQRRQVRRLPSLSSMAVMTNCNAKLKPALCCLEARCCCHSGNVVSGNMVPRQEAGGSAQQCCGRQQGPCRPAAATISGAAITSLDTECSFDLSFIPGYASAPCRVELQGPAVSFTTGLDGGDAHKHARLANMQSLALLTFTNVQQHRTVVAAAT